MLDRNRQFCGFEPRLRGLGATYDDHLRIIGKRVVDFLLVLTTSKYQFKIGDFAPTWAG